MATGLILGIALLLSFLYLSYKKDKEYKLLDDKVGKDGYTELMAKSWANDIAGMQVLIKNGADLNAQDHEGMTALMHSCIRSDGLSEDSVDALEELITAGADPNLRRLKGERAVDLAYNLKHRKQVEFLEKYSDDS